jgi:hypothetical protein
MFSKFTSVVTNFGRLDKLPKVLDSLGNNHEIVVASYGAPPGCRELVAQHCPGARHFCIEEDYGCNRLWLQAAEMAQTKWIAFLPDDDLRPPGFGRAAQRICESMERHGAGFASWNGQAYYWDSDRLGHPMNNCFVAAGVYDPQPLANRIMAKGKYPFSQAAFLYDRETVLDVLTWCEDHLQDCFTRPTMMAGNDIALTLGHIQRFPRMVQSAQRLIWYGHWDGAETLQYAAGKNDLMNQYDKARLKLQNIVFPHRKT